MIGKLLVGVGVLSAIILSVILNSTTPATAGAFGILLVFIFTYLTTVSVLSFVVYGVSKGVSVVENKMMHKSQQSEMRLQRAYYFATILSLAPVIIMSLQSVGGVGIYELGLTLLFVALGCVYVTKRTAS